MITRRNFISHASAFVLGSGLLARHSFAETSSLSFYMPDEGSPHQRTWMSFGASEEIWGKELLSEVRHNLATIAKTIAKYEHVSMLVRNEDYDIAHQLVGESVELIIAPLNDLWMRDIGPVFVKDTQGMLSGVDFNFNGWGKKQDFSADTKVAAFVTSQAKVPRIRTNLVLEGGGIEVDGQGTAIITESCVLNDNRNPNLSKAQCEVELKRLLGLQKIIWLPGIKDEDITDGHTDFYARFAKPGVVVAGYDSDPSSIDNAVTKKHLEILKTATDAKGLKLQVVVIEGPETIRKTSETDDFASGYINFYVCNKAVIMPEFGDVKADLAAKNKLQALFPNRDIIQLNIDGIASGGGGIHCTTQQEPKG